MALEKAAELQQSQTQLGYGQEGNGFNMVDEPAAQTMLPFNPTDFFREMIFSTDFLNDFEPPYAKDCPDQAAHGQGVSSTGNPGDGEAAMAEEPRPVDFLAGTSFAIADEFAFDLEDLQALETEQRLGDSEVRAPAEVAADTGADFGTVGNEDDIKPKEQND